MATIKCLNLTFPNVQTVIFDKDGTLADSRSFLLNLAQKRSHLLENQISGIQNSLLMTFGIRSNRLDSAGLMAVGSRRENILAAAAHIAQSGKGWLEAVEMACLAFEQADQQMSRKADQTPLFDGGLELLKTLANANLKVGILSADTTDNVKDFVQRYELEPYVQLQMGTDAGLSKPDPALFRQACDLLDVAPESALMVGDARVDIEMAGAAGAAGCIGVTWGWTDAANLADADVAIARFDEIQLIS